MKKTLLLLLALTTAAVAGEYGVTLLEVDFTKVSKLPSGWSEGSYKDKGAQFGFSPEKGAILVGSKGWEIRYMETQLSLSSRASSQINFELYNNHNDSTTGVENSMYLTSSSGHYSIIVGNSLYDSDAEPSNDGVYVGLLDADVGDSIYYLSKYQEPDGSTIGPITDIQPSADAAYTLTFADGKLSVRIIDANGNEWSSMNPYSVPDVTFDTIGFVVCAELEKNGVKNVSVRTVPEPAMSVLSLLSLAGLAARRRRR